MSFIRELEAAILRRKGWRIATKAETQKLYADIQRRRNEMMQQKFK